MLGICAAENTSSPILVHEYLVGKNVQCSHSQTILDVLGKFKVEREKITGVSYSRRERRPGWKSVPGRQGRFKEPEFLVSHWLLHYCSFDAWIMAP